MRAAYDALDAATKAEIEDLVCEHSLIYSRGQLGFTEFLPDERVAMKPVRHRLVRTHPARGASRCSCRPISAPSSAGRSPRRWLSSAT